MKVRVGVIGGGTIARKRHLPEIEENQNAEVVAVCDMQQIRANELAEQYHAKAYTDYKALLLDPNIDAVVVCATNTTHAKMSIEAMQAGKDVLCEKPMAASLQEAEEMIKVSEKTGKVLFVAHNLRLAPAHVKAKQLLKTNMLGKVITFRSVFGHPGCEFWAIDKGKTWFFKKEITRFGSIGDLGIHKIDLLRWLMDDEFTHVMAMVETLDKKDADGKMIDVEDNASMILKTKKGATGNVTVSWTYQKEDNSTVLYCQYGVMTIYGDPKYQIVIERNDGSSDYYKVGEVATNTKQVKSGIIDAFIDCIVKGDKPYISGYDGLEALRVVFAAYESSERRKSVKIDN